MRSGISVNFREIRHVNKVNRKRDAGQKLARRHDALATCQKQPATDRLPRDQPLEQCKFRFEKTKRVEVEKREITRKRLKRWGQGRTRCKTPGCLFASQSHSARQPTDLATTNFCWKWFRFESASCNLLLTWKTRCTAEDEDHEGSQRHHPCCPLLNSFHHATIEFKFFNFSNLNQAFEMKIENKYGIAALPGWGPQDLLGLLPPPLLSLGCFSFEQNVCTVHWQASLQ